MPSMALNGIMISENNIPRRCLMNMSESVDYNSFFISQGVTKQVCQWYVTVSMSSLRTIVLI